MNAKTWRPGLVLALLAFAGAAFAAEEQVRSMGLAVNGGLNMYSGGLAGLTNAGPAWGASAIVDSAIPLLETELAYEGGRNNIDDSIIDENGAAIWKNGVSALAKVGPTLYEHIAPYLGVGIGGSFLHPSAAATPVFQDDFVFEVPFAAGLDWRSETFMAGVRATWRPFVGLEVADGPLGSPNGGLFVTTANVGGRF